MTRPTSRLVVALDATARDADVMGVAGRLATTTGVPVAVVLPRTRAVADRLAGFATSEELTAPDAAEAYAERMADRLRDRGIATTAASLATDDGPSAIVWYVRRHGAGLVLVAGPAGPRGRLGHHTVAERLARTPVAPVLVVPTADQDLVVT